MGSTNPKMDLCNHKTVFVIDHSPYFGISSEDPMEFEQTRGRSPNVGPTVTITKSLWTSSLEAAIEYSRIVWDLFPEGKLIRFIASDCMGHHFNTWDLNQQNIQHVLNGSLLLGPPPPPAHPHTSKDFSVMHGLRAAIDVLALYTDEQLKFKKSGGKVLNYCRVICITSTIDNESMNSLQEIYLLTLSKAQADNALPIDFCDLIVINIFPNNGETLVIDQPPRDISPNLRTEVHSIRCGKALSELLSGLILNHYDLASTTVTGIPMKEEQNANSSANYDVEIFHHANAHSESFKSDIMEGPNKVRKTMTLKWCTPRGNPQDMYNCTAVYRVTPVDINSRPSSCLINFLLGGRSVLLEMPRRSGGKTNSHLLSAHGGEIFIHTLATGRSVLEDPPSISEGFGGRVTDYRVADFAQLIQVNKVIPLKLCTNQKSILPIIKMKNRLDRLTKYWPITISSTFLFNIRQYVDPLPALICKDELTSEEVTTCRQVIYSLAALESKNEPLVASLPLIRGKPPKREEQFKMMWTELEKMVRAHCRTDAHNKILYTVMELRSKDPDKSDRIELDDALRELDAVPVEPIARATVIRATTDSPMSPPPVTKCVSIPSKLAGPSRQGTMYSGPKSILDIWMNVVESEDKTIKEKRPDFYGRRNGGNFAVLYPKRAKEDTRDEPMVE